MGADRGAIRARSRGDHPGSADLRQERSRDRLLGHGDHPAQAPVDTIRLKSSTCTWMCGQIGVPGPGSARCAAHSNVQGLNRTNGDQRETQRCLPRSPGAPLYGGASSARRATTSTRRSRPCTAARARRSSARRQPGTAAPDTDFTCNEALRKSELNVQDQHQAQPQPPHGLQRCPDPALCLGRTESTCSAPGPEDQPWRTPSAVHASTGMNEPVSPLCLSEIDIVARMAEATLGSESGWTGWPADDYALLRDLIAETIAGFDDFNRRIEEPLRLPPGERRRPAALEHPSGRAEFQGESAARLPSCPSAPATRADGGSARAAAPEPAFPRSVQHHHLRHGRPLPRHQGRRNVVFMNGRTPRRLGLAEEQQVDMTAICKRRARAGGARL